MAVWRAVRRPLRWRQASTLTDNGMVFTTRLSGGKGGRNALEHELRRLGVKQKNGKLAPSRPNDYFCHLSQLVSRS
jgi:hypothetical protein